MTIMGYGEGRMHGDGPHRSSELREHRTTIRMTVNYVSGASREILYPSGFEPVVALSKLRALIFNARARNEFFKTDSSSSEVGTDINLSNVEWIDYEIVT